MHWPLILSLVTLVLMGILLILLLKQQRDQRELDKQMLLIQASLKHTEQQRTDIQQLLHNQQQQQQEQRTRFDEHQLKSLKLIQDSLHKAMLDVREQVSNTLMQNSKSIGERVDKLTNETQNKLKEISQEVDKQLTKGFEKTTQTFTDVIKRLAIIDEAQKKITELSGNVVSLQAVLSDKKSRGAFGEVQLANLIRDMLPASNFSLQHTLSNGKRVDCLLLLPEPTGHLAIDAKFPLESYRKLHNKNLAEADRHQTEQQFRLDIRKHIQDIANKYIIASETADGAIMFIPAESIFAEIHAHYPELVEIAHKARVWLTSPTTMMAILTTASAVLKDDATRKQVHIIQEHLITLGKDFERFQKRMDNLARHIHQANEDVTQVHKSSQKITGRFNKIEKVELELDDQPIKTTPLLKQVEQETI